MAEHRRMTTPFVAADTAIHLEPGGAIRTHELGETFSFRDQPGFDEGHVVSVFRYAQTWPYRERHPGGDELAVVLEGRVEVLVDRGEGEHAVRARAGEGCVIPAGAWHRLAVDESSVVLFVTPAPARTEHQDL
jgi:quercetin dioxygenase-like cupin family protein